MNLDNLLNYEMEDRNLNSLNFENERFYTYHNMSNNNQKNEEGKLCTRILSTHLQLSLWQVLVCNKISKIYDANGNFPLINICSDPRSTILSTF